MGRKSGFRALEGILREEGEGTVNDGETFLSSFSVSATFSRENIFSRYIKMETMVMMTMGCFGGCTSMYSDDAGDR